MALPPQRPAPPIAGALAGLLLVACQATPEPDPVAEDAPTFDIAPRFQWEANFGYCGETAFISAGLSYGQYLSQYDARAIASGGVDQSRPASQLLLGVNAEDAAARMHLRTAVWSGSGPEDFLVWVKQNVLRGYPVIIGVYNNERRIYDERSPDAGDAEYDHIVPVLGVTTDGAADDYRTEDTLTFSDNGLVGDDTPEGSDYRYTYEFGAFPLTRAEANAADGPWYALSRDTADYGVAVTGVIDPDGETLPVHVETSVNYESPEIEDGSSTRPTASDLELRVTVSGLTPDTDYVLYRYDALDAVPDSDFNAHSDQAAESWPIRITEGTTWTRTDAVRSSDVVVYRAVRADG